MVIYFINRPGQRNTAPAAWLKNGTYGDEVMQANWNPAVIQMIREPLQTAPSPALPDDMSTINVR